MGLQKDRWVVCRMPYAGVLDVLLRGCSRHFVAGESVLRGPSSLQVLDLSVG